MAKKRKKNRRRATASEECGDDGRGAEGLTSCSDSSGAGTGRTVISQHARHPKQDAGDSSKEPSAALPNVQDCTNQGMRNGTTTSRKRRASEDNSTSDDVPNTSSTSTRTFSSVKPPPTLKKKRRKKHKRKAAPDDTGGLAASSIASATQTVKEGATPALVFPYPVDPDDHCETPAEAFRDIAVFLSHIGVPKEKFRIYDPYYCDGAVIEHLQSLGFPNVYNKKEDCYQRWSCHGDPLPPFDVLVTNPPYSENHIEKLLRFATSRSFGDRPWFLLMPHWVHKKDFYLELTKDIRPFYLVPRKRYVYLPPNGFRAVKKSDVHKKSSPFVSMWFCWGGNNHRNEQLMRKFQTQNNSTCDLARSKSALRDLRRRNR